MVDFDAENIETLREEGGRGALRRERERERDGERCRWGL